MSGHFQSPLPLPWKTNVMGLLGECRVLLVSIMCPPVAYYVTSEAFEKPPAGILEACIGGYCLCCGFLLRTRLRDKYNLDGSVLGDLLTHCCCHCVALARIWREAEVQAEAEAIQHQQQQLRHHGSGPNVQLPGMMSQSLPQPLPSPQVQQQIPQPQFMAPGLQQQMGYGLPYQQSPLYAPMPQPAVMMRPIGNVLGEAAGMIPADQRNTIDTNLSSDFESRNDALGFRQDTGSCVRHNSMDPPPSNTDPDPWGMMPVRAKSSAFPAPPVGLNQTPGPKQGQSLPVNQRKEQVVADGPSGPFEMGQIKEEEKPKESLMSKRLAGLRPPNQQERRSTSEGSTAKKVTDAGAMADQVMLGGMDYVKILSLSRGESEIALPGENSQEDPPQHQGVETRVDSGESKTAGNVVPRTFSHDTPSYLEGSFLTQGATAGSENPRISLNDYTGGSPPRQ